MPRSRTTHSRSRDVACHLCFQAGELQEWIKEQGRKGGTCPWCGSRRGYLIPLAELSEPFREVASVFVPVEGPDAHERGEWISFLLDDGWDVFSEKIQGDVAQELAEAILYADLPGKERLDYPDYSGFFEHKSSTLEDDWDERAYAALTGDLPNASRQEAEKIESEIDERLPSQIEIAFEDAAKLLEKGTTLYRARVHKDRGHKERFTKDEVSAPPPDLARAGRANRKGEPVLYLCADQTTALAEVRAWKGAAIALAEVRVNRKLRLVDLTRSEPLRSPFFVELLSWRLELSALLRRLGEDMSRPVMPHEAEVLYKPTQLLAWLIKSRRYDGVIYPSAMGPGTNMALFNPEDAEVTNITYVRVKAVSYGSEPLSQYEDVYEEGPYDFALAKE